MIVEYRRRDLVGSLVNSNSIDYRSSKTSLLLSTVNTGYNDREYIDILVKAILHRGIDYFLRQITIISLGTKQS